jgi:hypothetical protein
MKGMGDEGKALQTLAFIVNGQTDAPSIGFAVHMTSNRAGKPYRG